MRAKGWGASGHVAGLMMVLFAGIIFGSVAKAQTPANPYSYSRSSSFSYDATTGLLTSETVEPDNLQSCVVTSYGYDGYGNKTSSSTASCSGATGRAVVAARSASSSFASASSSISVAGVATAVQIPAGQFSDARTNALIQTEHSTYDPRFGVTLALTGPNGLTTTWSYDDFGRKTVEKRADGTSTVTAYCYLSSSGLDTSSNSAQCSGIAPASGEVPTDAVMFAHTEPHDASASQLKNGPFVRVYTDRAGRTLRTVTEAFDGSTQVGGAGRLIVQDTDYSTYGVPVVATQPYFLGTASSTAAGSNDYGMTRNDVDRLGRVVANYVADAKGSQSAIAFGSRGSRTASLTRVAYSALTSTTTNDLGQARIEEKAVGGQVARVTDATGAQLAQQYDAFGNLVATKDALQNAVTLAYDIRGRKVSMTDPDTGLWKYDYDALGELVWQEAPNERAAGQVTTIAYDALGRITQRSEPEAVGTWSYDNCAMGVGKLCQSATTAGLSRKYVYDSVGRPTDVRTDVTSGPSFANTLQYDNVNGRLSARVYPTGLKVSYGYTANGFLSTVQAATALVVSPRPATSGGSLRSPAVTLAAGTVLLSAMSMNAWGRLEQHRDNTQSGGQAVTTTIAYDAMSGRVAGETAGLGSATSAMNVGYTWDSLGRVTLRKDNNGDGTTGAVTDTLSYDAVGRLQTDAVAAPAIPNLARTVQFTYNALGMLLSKSDVGNYSYPAAGSARPHAVQSVSGAYNASYTYDANGNAVAAAAGAWRGVTYTSFNLPDSQGGVQGPSGGPQYKWFYDENHARFKDVRTNSSGTRTTWMLHPDNVGGLGFEREEQAAGNSNRHYIMAAGMTVAVVVTADALPTLGASTTSPTAQASLNVVKLEFWHVDRQGSLISTTDHAGAITAVYTYDPFGKRRMTNGNYDASGALIVDWTTNTDNGTDRGYTGHEHLDDVGLIHMNGRMYDPMISRFMQGDPFIADPSNLQDYDRFTYCMNNPETCTDPSGYWHLFGHNILPGVFHNQTIMSVVAIAASVILMQPEILAYEASIGIAGAGSAAVAGFASGAIATGNIKGALQGAVTAAAFYGAGSIVGNSVNTAGKVAESIALHAVVGCASSAASGGKCGSGALSAAFSDAVSLTPQMQDLTAAANANDKVALIEGTTISAISGGTASVLGGGKFSNGAETGAAGYLFNSLCHQVKSCAQVGAESGAEVGFGVGVLADAGCSVATAGVCALSTVPIVGGTTALGTAIGYGLGRFIDGLTFNGSSVPTPPVIPAGWSGDTPPAEGWEWRGPDAPGGARGGWVSPDGDESLHGDPNHPPPVGPHVDWNDKTGGRWRIFPDGAVKPK